MTGYLFSYGGAPPETASPDFTKRRDLGGHGIFLQYSDSDSLAHNASTCESTGIFVLVHGEIDNIESLSNGTDHDRRRNPAEIIAEFLERDTEERLAVLSGLFAIVACRLREKTVTLHSDPIGGIHTTYYTFTGSTFHCSSCFHAVAKQSGASVDEASLASLIARGYVLAPHTMAREVRKTLPGSLTSVANGQASSRVLRLLPFLSPTEPDGRTGVEHLERSIARHMGPDACFLLSGGLDSSTLVALAARQSTEPVRCFTGTFPEHGALDESGYARLVAAHTGARLECVDLGGENVLQNLPGIVHALGEPFLDYSILPTCALFKEISKHHRQVFSGDGPDHLFGRYYPLAAKRTLGLLAKPALRALARTGNAHAARLLRSASDDIEYAYGELFALPNWGHNDTGRILSILNGAGRAQPRSGYIRSLAGPIPERGAAEVFAAINFADFYIDGSFGVFAKVGKAASAANLTVREPYLGGGYAQFAASLPARHKIGGGFLRQALSRCTTKRLLREEVSARLLPHDIIHRRKGGFTPPLEHWLSAFVTRHDIGNRLSCSFGECFDKDKIRDIFSAFSSDRRYGCIIFLLLSFDLWCRLFIERDIEDPHAARLGDIYA